MSHCNKGRCQPFIPDGEFKCLKTKSNAHIGGDLEVCTCAVIGSKGNLHVCGDSNLDGDVRTEGDLFVEGHTTIEGNLTVLGSILPLQYAQWTTPAPAQNVPGDLDPLQAVVWGPANLNGLPPLASGTTFTVPTSGIYALYTQLIFPTTADPDPEDGQRLVGFRVTEPATAVWVSSSSNYGLGQVAVSHSLTSFLPAGTVITVTAAQNSGGALALVSVPAARFYITRLQ